MTVLNTNTNDSAARSVSQRGDPQHAGFQIKRRWERLNATSADALAVALNAVTTYTDPKVDNQPYAGSFIQSFLDPKTRPDDSIDIEQTLTKVKANLDETDADIVGTEADPKVSGFKLFRAWHYINPYSLDTLLPTVNDCTHVTNPKGNTDSFAGKFVISRVRSIEQTDRTYDVVQDMVKVKTVDSVGDLTDPLIDRAKDIIHPFGEGTGVGRDIVYRYVNLDPASDTNCMAIADSALVARMSQNDSFIHTNRKTTTEDDRTMTFWILAQRQQRIKWTSTIYASPDHIETDLNGRDGSVKHKTWYGIDNDCYAGVLSKLRDTASVDTNYSILSVKIRDNDDGSDDWSQTLIKQFNDTRTDSLVVNSHGLQHTAVQRKHADFDNYATEPPTPDLTPDFNFVEKRLEMNNNGLLRMKHIQEKPNPSNAVSAGVPEGEELRDITRPMVTQLNATGKREQYIYDHIPIGDADSVVRTLDVTTDTRYIVEDIGWDDMGRGNAMVSKAMKRINYNGSWFVSEAGEENNNNPKVLNREWPYVLDSYADVLMGATGLARTNFTSGSYTYLPIRAYRTRHYDGTSTVRQIASTVSATVQTGGGYTNINGTDSEPIAFGFFLSIGQERQESVFAKIFGNFDSAVTFARASTPLTKEGFNARRYGSVSMIGKDKWEARKSHDATV